MRNIFWQSQLCTFLNYCERSEPEERKILDCGAGGKFPPLAIFQEYGYQTTGVEIDDKQLERATDFEKEHNLDLNIIKGDMRELPFEDESFNFVYSYNAIFHMVKEDIDKSIGEMSRVLEKEGLCFVNLLTTDDGGYGRGEEINPGEFRQEEGGEPCVHTYYHIDEADQIFLKLGLKIIYKERRIRHMIHKGQEYTLGYQDYILKKK